MVENNATAEFVSEKNDALEITVQQVNEIEGSLVCHLKGYIDIYNSSYFEKQVFKFIDSGNTRLVFDCSQVTYMSSTAISAFISIQKKAKPLKGDLVLLKVIPRIFEVFSLLGFSKFFDFSDSLEEALSLFTQKRKEVEVSIFPLIFNCPICSKKLKAPRDDRFRCSECKTILEIDKAGKVYLG